MHRSKSATSLSLLTDVKKCHVGFSEEEDDGKDCTSSPLFQVTPRPIASTQLLSPFSKRDGCRDRKRKEPRPPHDEFGSFQFVPYRSETQKGSCSRPGRSEALGQTRVRSIRRLPPPCRNYSQVSNSYHHTLWPLPSQTRHPLPYKRHCSRQRTDNKRWRCFSADCFPQQQRAPKASFAPPHSNSNSSQVFCKFYKRSRSFGEEAPLLHLIAILHPTFTANDASTSYIDRKKQPSLSGLYIVLLFLLLIGTVFGISLLVGMIIYQPVMIISTIIDASDITVLAPVTTSQLQHPILTSAYNTAEVMQLVDHDANNNSFTKTSTLDSTPSIVAHGRFLLRIRLQSLTSFSTETDLCYGGCAVYALAIAPGLTDEAIFNSTGNAKIKTRIEVDEIPVSATAPLDLYKYNVGTLRNVDARPYGGSDITHLEAKLSFLPLKAENGKTSRLCYRSYMSLMVELTQPAIYTFSGVVFYPEVIFPPFLYPCNIDF